MKEEELMTNTVVAPRRTPDLAAVKQKQQQAWASGDFHAVAARIVLVAEQLVDTADLRAGWHVLDVATGSGNAAIAAARLGCQAIGVDYVPSLLARGRERATAEGLDVALLEGDAEALPFPDRSFDAVTSVFGSMFAPDHEKAASELVRVTKPGGTIALASWTPDRVHRRAVPHRRGARATSRGRPLADAVGHPGASREPVRQQGLVARGDASGTSPSGSARRRSSSSSSAPGTGRP